MSEFSDTYLTLAAPSEGLYKEKGSKFIAYAFPVFNEEDIKERQAEVRKLHHAARHHCYAWRLGHEKKHFRANDDGEPSNSAGKPILGQLQAFDVTNVLIIVVRYFGGTKLGVGGLIGAYRAGAKEALETGNIVERTVMAQLALDFEYGQMSPVMKIVKDENLEQLKQDFDLRCRLTVAVRLNDVERIQHAFENIEGVEVEPQGWL